MAKPRITIKVRLPAYVSPHNRWRRRIIKNVKREQIRRAVPYPTTALVELTVKLYLRDGAEAVHDIDNRLKDVMDALQALKDLRSVTQVGVSYQEYRSRLADTKIKVNRFLEGPDTASDAGLHVVDAMAYFEQAALTWQGDIGGLRTR